MVEVVTEAGKKRYPPDGIYDSEICTCTDECKDGCDGIKVDGTDCDCSACCTCRNDAWEAQFYEEA